MKYIVIREEITKQAMLPEAIETILNEHEGYVLEKVSYDYSEKVLEVAMGYNVPIFKIGDRVKLSVFAASNAHEKLRELINDSIVTEVIRDQVKVEDAIYYIPARWLVKVD